MAVQSDLQAIGLGASGIAVSGQFMRQIDHETRIAAGRPLADAGCLDEDDAITAAKLHKALGRRKPGEPATNDQPVSRNVSLGLGMGGHRVQNCVPTGHTRIARQSGDLSFRGQFRSPAFLCLACFLCFSDETPAQEAIS